MIEIKTKAELETKIKEFSILDPSIRWENGGDHHPKSILLLDALMAIDWNFCSDYFCWKVGGDGDSGETLLYQLDMIFELEDKGYIISKSAWH